MHRNDFFTGEARLIRKLNLPPPSYDSVPPREPHPQGWSEVKRQRPGAESQRPSDLDRFRQTVARAQRLELRMQNIQQALARNQTAARTARKEKPVFDRGDDFAREGELQKSLAQYREQIAPVIGQFQHSIDGVNGGDLQQFHAAVERREQILTEADRMLREFEAKAGLQSPPTDEALDVRTSPVSTPEMSDRIKPPVDRYYAYGWRDGRGQRGKNEHIILSFSTGWGHRDESRPLGGVNGNVGAMNLGLRQSIMLNNIRHLNPTSMVGTETGFQAGYRELDEQRDVISALAAMGVEVEHSPDGTGTHVRITYIPENEYIVIEGEKIWGPIGTKPVPKPAPTQKPVNERLSFDEWKERRDAGKHEREPVSGTLRRIAEIAGRNTEARQACERLRTEITGGHFRWGNQDLRAADDLIRSLARSEGIDDRAMNRVAPRNTQQLLRFIDMVLAGGDSSQTLVAEATPPESPSRPKKTPAKPKSAPKASSSRPQTRPASRPAAKPKKPASSPSVSPATPVQPRKPEKQAQPSPAPSPSLSDDPGYSSTNTVPPPSGSKSAEPASPKPKEVTPTARAVPAQAPAPAAEKRVETISGKKFSDLITWETTEEDQGADAFWKKKLNEQATPALLKVLDALNYAGRRVHVKGRLAEFAAYLRFEIDGREVHTPNIGTESEGVWAQSAASRFEEIQKEVPKPREVPGPKPVSPSGPAVQPSVPSRAPPPAPVEAKPAPKPAETEVQKRLPEQVKALIGKLIADKKLDKQEVKDGALMLGQSQYMLELRFSEGKWQYVLHTNTDKTPYSAKDLLTMMSKWDRSAQTNYQGFIQVVEELSGEKMPQQLAPAAAPVTPPSTPKPAPVPANVPAPAPAEAQPVPKPAPRTQTEAGPAADLPRDATNSAEMPPEISYRLVASGQGSDETISGSVDRLLKIIPVIQRVKGDAGVRQFLEKVEAQISSNANLTDSTRAKLRSLRDALKKPAEKPEAKPAEAQSAPTPAQPRNVLDMLDPNHGTQKKN